MSTTHSLWAAARREGHGAPAVRQRVERFVASTLRGWNTQAYRPLIGAPRDEFGRPSGDPARVPERYRALVGFTAFANALRELRELADAHGFEVAVSTFGAVDAPTRALREELHFELVEVWPGLTEYARAHGIDGWYETELAASAMDPHPSAISHGIVAATIGAALERCGMVERLMARRR